MRSAIEHEFMAEDLRGVSGVAVFQRFALMRDWTEHGNMKMSAMVSADHLHMTDASYDCLARQLSNSILRDTHVATESVATKG
jgi:hypothetical protein